MSAEVLLASHHRRELCLLQNQFMSQIDSTNGHSIPSPETRPIIPDSLKAADLVAALGDYAYAGISIPEYTRLFSRDLSSPSVNTEHRVPIFYENILSFIHQNKLNPQREALESALTRLIDLTYQHASKFGPNYSPLFRSQITKLRNGNTLPQNPYSQEELLLLEFGRTHNLILGLVSNLSQEYKGALINYSDDQIASWTTQLKLSIPEVHHGCLDLISPHLNPFRSATQSLNGISLNSPPIVLSLS